MENNSKVVGSTSQNELDQIIGSEPAGGDTNVESKEEMEKIKRERDSYKAGMLKYKEQALAAEEEKRRSALQPKEVIEGDSEDPDFDAKYQKKRAEEKAVDRNKNLGKAWARFVSKHSQYDPENDIDRKNYEALQSKTSKMYLGDDVDEIMDNLEFVHKGLFGTEKNKPNSDDVVDSGIGSTASAPRATEKKPDALTRPLNKHEQEAAAIFPGGEKAYRAALVKREQDLKN